MARTPRQSSPKSSLLPASERVNGSKLAAAAADRIVADVVARGWAQGEVLGSEAELVGRYGVSRAVFREAVRLVEHQHVARMRRGPGGGLVITSPTVESVIDAASIYLFFVNAPLDDVFAARLALEETVAQLAPGRLSEGDITALQELLARDRDGLVADHRELHALLARITGNPALELFVDFLNRLSMLYFPDRSRIAPGVLAASAKAHAAITDAVLAGNDGLARHRMRKHLEAEAGFLRRRRLDRQRLNVAAPRLLATGGKMAEGVARQVLSEVTADGWPVGRLLGSESDLMERYGVSRAVLREAVRLLEHHQVAGMRRGPGGGLFVAEPGLGAVTDAVALYLERRGIEPGQLFEVRVAVELVILELVVARLDDTRAARLEQALDSERSASDDDFATVGHDLHAVLAQLAGNRVLELLAGVLIRLTRIRQARPPGTTETGTDDAMRAHRRLVDAITARDLELARHRMQRHLGALQSWVR